MDSVRQSWTDDRLDDFRDEVNRRFDKVDVELHRVNDRLDSMQKTMIQSSVVTIAALIGLIATQL
jgi:hypothetical protein